MDPITIIAIVAGLLIAGFLIFIENTFEKILNPILGLIGLNASTGPLVCHRKQKETHIEIVIENQGKAKANLATLSITNDQGKKIYPVPFSNEEDAVNGIGEKSEKDIRKHLSSDKVNPGGNKIAYISLQELHGCNFQSLSVMDIHGKSWPVTTDK